MTRFKIAGLMAASLMLAIVTSIASPLLAETPKRGGILNFVVGSRIPSYDLHRETTFGVIHPIRPFYSLLIGLIRRIHPRRRILSVMSVKEKWTRWAKMEARSLPSKSAGASSSMMEHQ